MFFITLLLALLVASVSAHCPRSFLLNATSTYIAAQLTGRSSLLSSLLAPNLTYTENARPLSIYNGTISRPLKIDFRRSIHDTEQCASLTEIISATDPHPRVIHSRMVFQAATHKATLVESIVTDKGDWLFNANATLTLNAPEAWEAVPEARQDSRQVIQAVGDAYFDRFSDPAIKVPWGPPCYRLEGGMAARGTLKGEDCEMAWPTSRIVVPYRRYVVDEVMGAVGIFMGFPGLDRTQGKDPMPDSHLFRVEKGKIKYLHTASACVVDGCGVNSTTAPLYNMNNLRMRRGRRLW